MKLSLVSVFLLATINVVNYERATAIFFLNPFFPKITLAPVPSTDYAYITFVFWLTMLCLAGVWAAVYFYIVYRQRQIVGTTVMGRNLQDHDRAFVQMVDTMASMDKNHCAARLVCKVAHLAPDRMTNAQIDIINFLRSMGSTGSQNLHLVEASLAKSCDAIGTSCPFNVEDFMYMF